MGGRQGLAICMVRCWTGALVGCEGGGGERVGSDGLCAMLVLEYTVKSQKIRMAGQCAIANFAIQNTAICRSITK